MAIASTSISATYTAACRRVGASGVSLGPGRRNLYRCITAAAQPQRVSLGLTTARRGAISALVCSLALARGARMCMAASVGVTQYEKVRSLGGRIFFFAHSF